MSTATINTACQHSSSQLSRRRRLKLQSECCGNITIVRRCPLALMSGDGSEHNEHDIWCNTWRKHSDDWTSGAPAKTPRA